MKNSIDITKYITLPAINRAILDGTIDESIALKYVTMPSAYEHLVEQMLHNDSSDNGTSDNGSSDNGSSDNGPSESPIHIIDDSSEEPIVPQETYMWVTIESYNDYSDVSDVTYPIFDIQWVNESNITNISSIKNYITSNGKDINNCVIVSWLPKYKYMSYILVGYHVFDVSCNNLADLQAGKYDSYVCSMNTAGYISSVTDFKLNIYKTNNYITWKDEIDGNIVMITPFVPQQSLSEILGSPSLPVATLYTAYYNTKYTTNKWMNANYDSVVKINDIMTENVTMYAYDYKQEGSSSGGSSSDKTIVGKISVTGPGTGSIIVGQYGSSGKLSYETVNIGEYVLLTEDTTQVILVSETATIYSFCDTNDISICPVEGGVVNSGGYVSVDYTKNYVVNVIGENVSKQLS